MNFQKGTKSHKDLPKMPKIPRRTSKNAQNPMRNFQKCTKSHEKGSSSCDFVQFWKFLVGFCAFLEVPRRIVHI
jgi:hypothetical protein